MACVWDLLVDQVFQYPLNVDKPKDLWTTRSNAEAINTLEKSLASAGNQLFHSLFTLLLTMLDTKDLSQWRCLTVQLLYQLSLSERREDFPERHDNFSGRRDDFSDRHDDFSGRYDNFSDHHDDLSGRYDNFSDYHDDLSGRREDFSEHHKDFSGRREDFSGRHDDFSERHDDFSERRKDTDYLMSDVRSISNDIMNITRQVMGDPKEREVFQDLEKELIDSVIERAISYSCLLRRQQSHIGVVMPIRQSIPDDHGFDQRSLPAMPWGEVPTKPKQSSREFQIFTRPELLRCSTVTGEAIRESVIVMESETYPLPLKPDRNSQKETQYGYNRC